MNFHPRKKLGQNFLVDENIARKIISRFNPREGETVLEIGPGRGALTKFLVRKPIRLIAVEIDRHLAEELNARFAGNRNLTVVRGDFLKYDPGSIAVESPGKIRVIGNIPYSITGAILFRLIEFRDVYQDAFLMVQKEVAERIFAAPGGRDYGILSVILRTFSDLTGHFRVPRTVFLPEPEVDSYVFSMEFREEVPDLNDEDFFIQVVKTAFGQRRKQLRNALKPLIEGMDISSFPVDLRRRAETLTIEEFISLSNEIQKRNDNNSRTFRSAGR